MNGAVAKMAMKAKREANAGALADLVVSYRGSAPVAPTHFTGEAQAPDRAALDAKGSGAASHSDDLPHLTGCRTPEVAHEASGTHSIHLSDTAVSLLLLLAPHCGSPQEAILRGLCLLANQVGIGALVPEIAERPTQNLRARGTEGPCHGAAPRGPP